MPQNTAPISKKFCWAGGALCEAGPACGFFASTLAHAVPVCAGATGLGFGAAAADRAGIQIVLMASARATAVPLLLIIFVTSFVGERTGRGGTLGRRAVGGNGAGPGSGPGASPGSAETGEGSPCRAWGRRWLRSRSIRWAGRDSRRGTAALASVIAAAGGVACALSIGAPALRGLPLHPLDQAIHAGVAAAYIGTGVVAMLRRPGNAAGLLMAAIGFLWLVGDLYWIPGALAFTIAATFALFYETVLAHLALAFPSGRLPGGFERRVMIGLYAWTLVNNLVRMLFFDPHAEGCAGCPANLLLVVRDPGVERWRNDVTSYIDTAVIVAVAAVIVRHW